MVTKSDIASVPDTDWYDYWMNVTYVNAWS